MTFPSNPPTVDLTVPFLRTRPKRPPTRSSRRIGQGRPICSHVSICVGAKDGSASPLPHCLVGRGARASSTFPHQTPSVDDVQRPGPTVATRMAASRQASPSRSTTWPRPSASAASPDVNEGSPLQPGPGQLVHRSRQQQISPLHQCTKITADFRRPMPPTAARATAYAEQARPTRSITIDLVDKNSTHL